MPQHGEIQTSFEATFEGYLVKATMFIDPRKVQLTPAQAEEVRAWLQSTLNASVAHWRAQAAAGIVPVHPIDQPKQE